MQLDPERIAEVRGWLVKAAEDLRAGAFERTADPPIVTDMVFHAQQAAEKSLKALLTWHNQPFRRTHDLAELGVMCVEIESGLEDACRRAEPLTVFAWAFRDPGEPEMPSVEEAEAALSIAMDLHREIRAVLPASIL